MLTSKPYVLISDTILTVHTTAPQQVHSVVLSVSCAKHTLLYELNIFF